jgi:hypothetical protein
VGELRTGRAVEEAHVSIRGVEDDDAAVRGHGDECRGVEIASRRGRI